MRSLHLLLFFCFSFCVFFCAAQKSARLTGSVTDADSHKPIEYVSVSIAAKGKIINGVITDKAGNFSFKQLAPGMYMVTAAFVGYETYTQDSVAVTTSSDIHLTIELHTSAAALNNVTVVSKTPLVENKIDRIVYNAANDITSQGGAAIDILKKVPQVSVDIDGNVELQGNPNIRFLINGKPSAVFGSSLPEALAAIPASQIKSIEAITSPGAKYSAQGTGGIINIILKDNKLKGVNGVANLSAGTRLENGSVNIGYRKNNFGIGFSASANQQLVSKTPLSQQRTSSGDHANSYLEQNGYTDFQRRGLQAGSSLEWNISKSSVLSASVTLYSFSNKNNSVISQSQKNYDSVSGNTGLLEALRTSNSRSKTRSTDWSLGYTKQFKKEGSELSITWDASAEKPFGEYEQTQTYKSQSLPYSGRRSNNPGAQHESEIAADLSLPMGEDATIETGVSGEFSRIYSRSDVSVLNINSGAYIHDNAQSYTLSYKRQVYSVYVSTNFSISKKFLDVKAGMRFEQALTQIDFPNTSIPKNNMWVPSLMFSHKFNDRETIKIAFTKRLERPDYGDVNPWINLIDPYNISSGNPLLKPEIGHNTELGYSYNFKKGGNIYIALFERINTQDLKMVTVFYPTLKLGDSLYRNVSFSKRENFGTEYNTGITVSANVSVNAKLNLRTNISYTYRKNILNTGGGGLSGGRARMNVNGTYQFTKNFVGEAFANFNSAYNNIQGKSPQSLTYTFAFRKQFWNKKGSIGFTATNPFTQYVQQKTVVVANNVYSSYTRWIPYRSFGITFSWKFGKIEFKKQKEDDNGFQKDLPQQ